MAHFARVLDGRVTQVIVADQEVIDSGVLGEPSEWIQTSYNTKLNKHPEGRPLRGNFAVVDGFYDEKLDVFYGPSPHPSWTLNTSTFGWEAPVPYPTDSSVPYKWDEATQSWVEYVME